MLPKFSQTLTLQEVFETAAQINEELNITELNGSFCIKIQTSGKEQTNDNFYKNDDTFESKILKFSKT